MSFLVGCHDEAGFEDSIFVSIDPKEAGVDFENNLTYTEGFNAYLYRSFYNGAGVGLADLNNDGFLDIFFCGNQVDNKLYLGNGNFEFVDVTEKAGLSSRGSWSTGVSIVDINSDGLLDIYVCKSGNPNDKNRRNELFINKGIDGNGTPIFKEAAKEYGIDDLGFSIHAIFFDYDKDGDLDMYLSNNSINPTDMIMDAKKGMRYEVDPGGGDKLYKNEKGHFNDVSRESGIYSSAIGFGLGVSVGDVNRDGWPDIYVANDFFEKDYLYMNNGDGTFTESIAEMTEELSMGSMGVDLADMNHDGYPEIFVTEMLPEDEDRLKTKTAFENWDKYALKVRNGYHRQFPRNVFQLNKGRVGQGNKITFGEISRYSGVSSTDWSWGVQMADFDLDGNNEIFVTNGIPKDLLDQDYIDYYFDPVKIKKTLREKGSVIKELIDNIPSNPIPNYLFKDQGDLRFQNYSNKWGLDQPSFSSGSAYGDIDNDGDLDLVVSNIDAPPFIYRNNIDKAKNGYICLDLKNNDSTTAIGTQVTLKIGGTTHFKELYPIRGSMSTVDDRLYFGTGTSGVVDTLLINWPDGSKQVFTDVKGNQFLTYVKPSTIPLDRGEPKENNGWVALLNEVTNDMGANFQHIESNYVDFDKEKLLYHMISNEGPKIAVADINADGKEDFYIGGAINSAGSLFIQKGGGFVTTNDNVFGQDAISEDTNALFFDANGDEVPDLLVCSGSNEFPQGAYALLDRLYLNDGMGNFEKLPNALPLDLAMSTSVAVHFDYDGDGDQDLFLGGRSIPYNYGVPATSYLLENDGHGKFSNVTSDKAPDFINMGMVTDALKMDFDRDGDEDLIVVGEWMPIKIFSNTDGIFKDVTEKTGLSKTNGFWNVIEKADLDNDGLMDLVVGNLGSNSFFKASMEGPIKMYVNDFDKNTSVEQIITVNNGKGSYPIAQRKEITSQLPHLLKKYLKSSDYKHQQIEDIFTNEELKTALIHDVFQINSVILWNNGGKFQMQELPLEVQLAPVFAIQIHDLDNDGNQDIVFGGNQFRAKPQVGIYGASTGSVLRNLGKRKFKTELTNKSGFYVQGEIRDFKAILISNKEYLLVARNNDTLKIFEINNKGYTQQ
ncbi:MAG: VCBS repeat-containing protein [Bacteroidota bacterium]|nr:VCBS repeat-containing protein [Bacteroidota bacterium]